MKFILIFGGINNDGEMGAMGWKSLKFIKVY